MIFSSNRRRGKTARHWRDQIGLRERERAAARGDDNGFSEAIFNHRFTQMDTDEKNNISSQFRLCFPICISAQM
jgi:hypothetical protein